MGLLDGTLGKTPNDDVGIMEGVVLLSNSTTEGVILLVTVTITDGVVEGVTEGVIMFSIKLDGIAVGLYSDMKGVGNVEGVDEGVAVGEISEGTEELIVPFNVLDGVAVGRL